jgi:murein hydrolase activator
MTTLAVIRSCLFLILCAGMPLSANETRTKQDLSEIQKELKKSKQLYIAQQKDIAVFQTRLKKDEVSIAKSARALSKTRAAITVLKNEQSVLKIEVSSLKKQQQSLQKLLAKQLKSAYMTGTHDYSKMLLNQQNSSQLERTISYYDYFNNARISQINTLKQVSETLAQKQTTLTAKVEKLFTLQKQQTARQKQLLDSQADRKNNLHALNSTLSKMVAAIDYLKENEQTLLATLKELSTVDTPKKVSLNGLSADKGKLNWPSKGRLKHRYGSKKHTGMNWKGVLITAKSGAPITTIKQGQVVYADWLNGFGWVMVIDHGQGFMSLYGHAQTLLKQVGEPVLAGETIALVGQSGGQPRSGLYFEIRHKGSAVDPVKWCKTG